MQGLLHDDVLMKIIWILHIIYGSPLNAWPPSHVVNSFPTKYDMFMKSIDLQFVHGV